MGYLDDFMARVNATGNTIADSQSHSSSKFIESMFANSPFYKVATWNGSDLELRLMDVNSITRSGSIVPVQYDIKFALFKPNFVIDLGEIILIDDKSWMVVDFTSENPLFPKAKLQMCNFGLLVKTGETKTLVGYDDFKAPVYQTVPTEITMQAILKNTVGSTALNSEINLPSERMFISVTYNSDTQNIKENDVFNLYSRNYKVVGIDFSNVFYGKGIMTLTTERVVTK